MSMKAGKHKYTKHKKTKHRTIYVPEGFEFVDIEKSALEPRAIKVLFKKKRGE